MDVPTTAERFPRFSRRRFLKPPFVLQERDVDIIRMIAAHRVVSSDDVRLLVDGSGQGILRRLQKLFHSGYLDRPRSQRQRGNAPMVYALGQRGADLVAQELGRRPVADYAEKNRQLRAHYLEHSLMVSRFQVALRHAATASATVSLSQWLSDGAIREAAWVEHADRRERIPVAPDALFVLNVADGDESGRVHCLLEADRGTMTVGRFTNKVRGYFAYWRSGQAQQRLGVKNFLVVTVTRTDERARHLLEATKAVSNRGLRMFVFACESEYLPAPRRVVLDRIWRTANDGGRHSLWE